MYRDPFHGGTVWIGNTLLTLTRFHLCAKLRCLFPSRRLLAFFSLHRFLNFSRLGILLLSCGCSGGLPWLSSSLACCTTSPVRNLFGSIMILVNTMHGNTRIDGSFGSFITTSRAYPDGVR